MNETLNLVLALFAGAMLGSFFFGGLWWTIRRGLSSGLAALWFSGSLLVRTLIAVTGLYFVSHGDWRRLIACLLGFLLARMAVNRLTRIVEEGAR